MDTTLIELIKFKKEINSEIENYKIQIFSGNRIKAENMLKKYMSSFKDTTATIKYEAPNYKIWIGNYYTLIEAERKILEIRKKFANAFIFRPNKLTRFEKSEINKRTKN